ncbi:MAG: class I adenylate-forming enzyme family protein [Hyphomicrobiaceae bacterium]|nr:class I adenylate-forming enzyme family protein [Hyphomicrobiaceae bacterium]
MIGPRTGFGTRASTPAGSPISAMGCPQRFNTTAYVIARAAARHPQKEALAVYPDVTLNAPPAIWTYAALEAATLGIAAGFSRLGLARGDRILIRLDNTPEYAFAVFAAIAIGLVPVPLSAQLTAEDVAFIAADCAAAAIALADDADPSSAPTGLSVITSRDIMRSAATGERAALADTTADEPAYLVYTSGTTARPKGVVHGHRAAWGRRPMYEGWYAITPDDRVLHAGAFNWTFTLGTGLTDPWANGATAIVYTGQRKAQVWPHLIRQSGATIFAAVPGVFRQVLQQSPDGAIDLGSLRHALMAGEAPAAGLIDAWQQRTGTALYEALGMSEISTYVSSSPQTGHRSGFVGKPQPGRVVAILPIDGGTEPLGPGQSGLIAVHRSDPGLMLGYWNRPHEEAEVLRGDWFVGGDVGQMDAEGWIAHHGRVNDVMKPLGYRVAPQEIEAVLETCPGVAEAACAEIEVKAGVRVIGAFIVARDSARPPDLATLEHHAEQHLAAYKQPRIYRIVDSLPRTPNGKLQRARLAV